MSRFDLNSGNNRFYDVDDDDNSRNSESQQSLNSSSTGQFLPRGTNNDFRRSGVGLGGFGAFRNVLENNSPNPGTEKL